MFSKQNRRKLSPDARLVRVLLAVSVEHVAFLALLLCGQPAHGQPPTPIPRPTPPPQPAIPAGLVIGSRTLDRQDVPEYYAIHKIAQPFPSINYPGASERNAANVSAWTQEGKRGHLVRSTAPLWSDSDQSTEVIVSLGDGYLPLDRIATDADTVSVRVRDEHGGSVTLAQRAYRTQGQVEALDASVRTDEAGRLLALPVARLEAENGSVIVTRDGSFAEPLTVSFRCVRVGTSPYVFTPTQTITIPAGEASAPLAIQGKAGDVVTLRTGSGYTAAPAEDSDRIQF